MMQPLLYLASASPRRHELLNQISVKHKVLQVPSPPGEDEPRLSSETPLDYVQRTAFEKAIRAEQWIEKQYQNETLFENQIAILTADTTVALDNCIFGKPKDTEDAAQILKQLSGKTHTVFTALVLSQIEPQQNKDQRGQWYRIKALSVTQVSFCTLTEQAIRDYIETGEPFGKAGAYGIQGYAGKYIQRIDGSYSGVMGLPLFETNELLKQISASTTS